MAYVRAEVDQIDVWQTLGNHGWNWTTLLPYYIKSETFQIPKPFQVANGMTYNASYHGSSGPLTTGYVNGQINGTVGTTYNKTFAALNLAWDNDVNSGKMHGLNSPPKTIDQEANVRADAAYAYYWPIAQRQNLKLFQNTLANKIVWKSTTSCSNIVASGVQVVLSNGSTTIIHARKEVILSAGALRSPLILELSGIGNPDILVKYDIPVVVDLPTVGENLQDQMNNALAFGDNNTLVGSDSFVAYPTVADLFGADLPAFRANISSSLSAYANKVAEASNNVVSKADLLFAFKMQYDLIFNTQTPILEIYMTPAADVFSFQNWILLPFSRGNIHITSANASAAAAINPNYFMLDFDLQIQIASLKYVRKAMATAPLSTMVTSETTPGYDVVGLNATDAAIEQWIKQTYRTNYHPVATAAMMPKEIGGVVDSRLKVYGTSNVRVVDASVLPMQVCGHLTSTLYAVAEKAADMIKEDM